MPSCLPGSARSRRSCSCPPWRPPRGSTSRSSGSRTTVACRTARARGSARARCASSRRSSGPGTRDAYFGAKCFHGTPFRRAVEEGLLDPRRMVQVGIRGPLYGSEDFAFHEQHGIEVIRIETVKEQGVAWVGDRFGRLRGGPVYCSFDIDAVDPAYAPATGTPEVGGLTSYEAPTLVRALAGQALGGADIVEVSPPYDGPGQITSLLAANLLFEIVSLLALLK